MELLLIIIGGLLTTAIIFMMVDWLHWRISTRSGDGFESSGYDDPGLSQNMTRPESER